MSRIGQGYVEQMTYERIRDMIVQRELAPGEILVQDALAKRLGVSRTPLRWALQQLERDHLLETTPHGVCVREFSAGFMRSVWEMRAALEGLACRLAARRIDEPSLAYLRTLFTTAYAKWQQGDREAYQQADTRFHTMLIELAGNPLLQDTAKRTQVLVISLRLGLLRDPAETFPEHMAMIDALEARDEELADHLMQQHIRRSLECLPN